MTDRICTVPDCDRPYDSIGWCGMHGQRWRRHGDPLWQPRRPLPIEQRYWSHVDRTGNPAGCHEWTGSRVGGYGQFWDGTYNANGQGRKVSATRWAWEHFIGPIPPETPFVLHHCDNPPCQNQKHHWLGTAQDNNTDRDRKGRNGGHKTAGEANGVAKLTAGHVAEIRRRYAYDGIAQIRLADDYGVSQTLVSAIVRRIVWRDSA